jgi:pyruvate formate lyase activating enzyme
VIRIGGWARLSTCDWPAKLVTTVFCQGCPWRCGYCHNPGLLAPRARTAIEWPRILEHLTNRQGLLDGVVFSGGEPLLQPRLAEAMREVRARGFGVGLHTGGAYPRRFGQILDEHLVDWVGFDIKAAPPAYDKVTGVRNSAPPALHSLRLLLDSRIPRQLRTTVDPAVLLTEDVMDLKAWLTEQNLHHHVWQEARAQGRHPRSRARPGDDTEPRAPVPLPS